MKTDRLWGFYKVLYANNKEVKVKELVVDPGKRLSMQRHANRSEFWFVVEGTASVYSINLSTDAELLGRYTKHESVWISQNEWHQLANETDSPLKIIEIQYGVDCEETDIERSE